MFGIIVILLLVAILVPQSPGAWRDLGRGILGLFLYIILPFAVIIFFGIHGPLVWH